MALVVPLNPYENNGDAEDFLNGNLDDVCKDEEETEDTMKIDNMKPLRIIRKAKRPSKANPDGQTVNGTSTIIKNGNKLMFSKNSRRSRSGKGRGLPKKGPYKCFYFYLGGEFLKTAVKKKKKKNPNKKGVCGGGCKVYIF